MGFRVYAVVGVLALAAAPATAQKTGDQARLVFTVSGAYLQGKGLWNVPSQPIQDGSADDVFALNRSIKSTLAASASATYFPKSVVGVTAEAFLMGLGFDDACRLAAPLQSVRNEEVCSSIDRVEQSAAAVAVSTGAIFRLASREIISPFARISVGMLLTNQSSIRTEGTSGSNGGALTVVYFEENKTRVRPALALGVGTTFALSRGYALRWEVRDSYVGVVGVTGPTSGAFETPPHETTYKHLFSVHIGLDVVLERVRGRRY
jgi:hypothetical protein